MRDQQSIIKVLNQVSELLPKNKSLEPDVITLIRESALDYISYRLRFDLGDHPTYGAEELSSDISLDFEEISILEFTEFPLSLDEQTVANFLRGDTHYKKGSHGINPKSGSIRTIAAFLVIDDRSRLVMEDLTYKYLDNIAAQHVSKFINASFEPGDLTLEQLEGFYTSEFNDGNRSTRTDFEVAQSHDNTHILAEETALNEYAHKTHGAHRQKTTYYGWGVITQQSVILLTMKDIAENDTHLYVSCSTLVDENGGYTPETLSLQKFYRNSNLSPGDYFFNSKRGPGNNVLLSRMDSSLTNSKPLSDNNKLANISVLPLMNTRFSSGSMQTEKKEVQMNPTDKEKLSQELIDMFKCGAEFDADKCFSLLEQGASINYKDTRVGATVVHRLARWDLDLLNEVIDRSNEEYDYLARDKKGWLASMWAADNKESGVYDALKERERQAGAKQGVWPDVLRNMDMPNPE